MNNLYLTNLDTNYSIEKIFEEMTSIFNRYGRLLVLLDKTSESNSFDELLKHFEEENIIYLPLALGNKPKGTNLFFAIYKVIDSEEKMYETIAFNEVIIHQKMQS